MEYKWYLVKINHDSELALNQLVDSDSVSYFKDIFIPRRVVLDLESSSEELFEAFIYMYLCDESISLLKETSDFCRSVNDDYSNLEAVSDDEILSRRDKVSGCRWYSLKVASGYEAKVCQYMLDNAKMFRVHDYFESIFILYYKDDVSLRYYVEFDDIQLKSSKNIFSTKGFKCCAPGYIFLCFILCDKAIKFVNTVPKAYGFLLNENNIPREVFTKELVLMVNTLNDIQENKKLGCAYEKGESIKINDGPFQGFVGVIISLSDEQGV
ncbi:transcription termination/antitermination NusG family protein, partial [Wolbachia endosymbiont of Pentidionis agamae]|uniref:transcription termination/antitermination NusG family protein n=1 Tax=Wolbachia endosymbiont of Pentidionis agamae TaxID=3110435 RepID=UPI002FD5F9F1